MSKDKPYPHRRPFLTTAIVHGQLVLRIRQATALGYAEATAGTTFDLSYPSSTLRRARTIAGGTITNALTSTGAAMLCTLIEYKQTKTKMKHYIGTKTVLAQPMTKGEAHDEQLLHSGITPTPEERTESGYLVEYEDGYRSWTPKAPFDRAYRIAETPQDRMRIEIADLRQRMDKLSAFLDTDTYNTLKPKVRYMLNNQYSRMYAYLTCLEDRLHAMQGQPHDNTYLPIDPLLDSANQALNTWYYKDTDRRAYLTITRRQNKVTYTIDGSEGSENLAYAIAYAMQHDERIAMAISTAVHLFDTTLNNTEKA